MPYKLLVADDEAPLRALLQDAFSMLGYTVLCAANGREAVALAGQGPDLILLDVNMPDLDGLEVCRRIREHVVCPILFLTARVEDADKIEGFSAGGDDYILKPFSLDELEARVAAICAASSGRRQARWRGCALRTISPSTTPPMPSPAAAGRSRWRKKNMRYWSCSPATRARSLTGSASMRPCGASTRRAPRRWWPSTSNGCGQSWRPRARGSISRRNGGWGTVG